MDSRFKVEESWIAITHPYPTIDIKGDVFVYQ
jgi:hypothetical protein